MRAHFVLAAVALFGLTACNGGGSSSPAPTPTPAPSPGPLTASPADLTLSVSGAGGVPESGTITLTQTGLTSAPTATDATNTCYSIPASAADLTKPNGSGTSSFNSTTGTLTATQGLTALRFGRCSLSITSSAGPSTATVTVTIDP